MCNSHPESYPVSAGCSSTTETFTFFFLICVRGGMSYLTLLRLESGGKNKNNIFAIMLQRRVFSSSFTKPFCKPFQIPFVEVRNLAFSVCLCQAEAT